MSHLSVSRSTNPPRAARYVPFLPQLLRLMQLINELKLIDGSKECSDIDFAKIWARLKFLAPKTNAPAWRRRSARLDWRRARPQTPPHPAPLASEKVGKEKVLALEE